MIHKPAVLLRIQNLKKGRRSIPLIITAGLINLIQQHKRIIYPGLLQSDCDSSRHCSHISFSVATDFCLVPNTAQADPYIFFMQSLSHRFGNRCLTCSRRPYQTKDRTFTLMCQFTDRKELHNTFLYIL